MTPKHTKRDPYHRLRQLTEKARRSDAQHEADMIARNAEMATLHEAGYPLRSIAEPAGLSHQAVAEAIR